MLGTEEFTIVMPCTSSEIKNGNSRMNLTMIRIIPDELHRLEQTTALVASAAIIQELHLATHKQHLPYEGQSKSSQKSSEILC
jgi:hypothetical protein